MSTWQGGFTKLLVFGGDPPPYFLQCGNLQLHVYWKNGQGVPFLNAPYDPCLHPELIHEGCESVPYKLICHNLTRQKYSQDLNFQNPDLSEYQTNGTPLFKCSYHSKNWSLNGHLTKRLIIDKIVQNSDHILKLNNLATGQLVII